MTDLYRDSAHRYAHDAEFAALVDMLFHYALEHGLTPGELKQIAFFAALKAEQYATRTVTIPQGKDQELQALMDELQQSPEWRRGDNTVPQPCPVNPWWKDSEVQPSAVRDESKPDQSSGSREK